jgi:hypothetical protein
MARECAFVWSWLFDENGVDGQLGGVTGKVAVMAMEVSVSSALSVAFKSK